jgi:hypothetical protein
VKVLHRMALLVGLGIVSYAGAQLIDPPRVEAHFCCHTFGDCLGCQTCTGGGCHGHDFGWCEGNPCP